MNANRKADLQRRLSMASVPKPPADLASRIKQDIPASLGAARPPWYGTPALRIAASLVVVVACAVLALRVLSHAPATEGHDAISMSSKAARDLTTPKAESVSSDRTAPIQPAAAPAATPESPKPVVAAAPSLPREAAAPARAVGRQQVAANEPVEEPAVTEAKPKLAESAPAAQDSLAVPSPAPPVSAAAARGAVQQAAGTRNENTITVTASAPAIVTDSRVERALQPAGEKESDVERGIGGGVAGGVTPTLPTLAKTRSRDAVVALPPLAVTHSIAPSMFGISTDPAAMEAVRTAIKDGSQPSAVDIEAIVNYFASKADEPPQRMTLQVEGSPPPVLATPRTRIVRITIDTPRSESCDPVAATDAFLSISFDPRTVVVHHLIGGTPTLTPSQRIVLKNTSVTALYEIQLRTGVRPRQTVVTARLTYRDGASGKPNSLPVVLKVGDIDRAWLDASYRHRLTTLGAIWGESLKNTRGDTEVARRAEELAQQAPQDRKARELAELASASSRRRSSGSTGSGR